MSKFRRTALLIIFIFIFSPGTLISKEGEITDSPKKFKPIAASCSELDGGDNLLSIIDHKNNKVELKFLNTGYGKDKTCEEEKTRIDEGIEYGGAVCGCFESKKDSVDLHCVVITLEGTIDDIGDIQFGNSKRALLNCETARRKMEGMHAEEAASEAYDYVLSSRWAKDHGFN